MRVHGCALFVRHGTFDTGKPACVFFIGDIARCSRVSLSNVGTADVRGQSQRHDNAHDDEEELEHGDASGDVAWGVTKRWCGHKKRFACASLPRNFLTEWMHRHFSDRLQHSLPNSASGPQPACRQGPQGLPRELETSQRAILHASLPRVAWVGRGSPIGSTRGQCRVRTMVPKAPGELEQKWSS
jgi:hypothetical protein